MRGPQAAERVQNLPALGDISLTDIKTPLSTPEIVLSATLTCQALQLSAKCKCQEVDVVKKAISGSNWGPSAETLIGGSVLNFLAPVWSPSLKPSHPKKLQTRQNAAFQVTTGCLAVADKDRLHRETKILPIYCTANYPRTCAIRCQTNHPRQPCLLCHDIRKYRQEIDQDIPTDKVFDEQAYRDGRRSPLRTAVEDAVAGYRPVVVLGGRPTPEVDKGGQDPNCRNSAGSYRQYYRQPLPEMRTGPSRYTTRLQLRRGSHLADRHGPVETPEGSG
ncbi:uncharacterized protein LOC133503576 [Syngnathoides biaculeatus]|uniref:uncharacterized protein LOC133503576 n=1 Tax=Syngnathoides biaculeatus TaxID=300417 RepID=UPI002ADE37B6|nr:uncharacterized protein LOC133503576 [Syngnathoides biaculeatus]